MNFPTIRHLFMVAGLVSPWLACAINTSEGPSSHDDHAHTNDHGDEPEHGHDHGQEDDHTDETSHADHGDETQAVTFWSRDYMLYIEYPSFEPGVETELLVHVTRLEGHSAVSDGTLLVRLQDESDESIVSPPVEVARPGIFRPRIVPGAAGHAQLVVAWQNGESSEVWSVGEVDIGEHGHGHAHDEAPPSGIPPISYLLEQQWTRPFSVAEAQIGPMSPELTVFGHLQVPESSRSTVTASAEGRIAPIGVRLPLPGDAVLVGQELFSLQTALPSDHDPVEVAQQLDSSVIERDAARQELERVQPLVEQGVLPARRLTEAQTRLAQADSAVSTARRRSASIQRAGSLSNDAQGRSILAPVSGRVLQVLTSPNEWVQEGDVLLHLIQTDSLWLEAMVPEVWASQMGTLRGVSFQIDHQDAPVALAADALISVAPAIDEATHSLPVLFRVPPDLSDGLVAGMTAVVRLATGDEQQVLSVPGSSLVDDNGTIVVFVQTSGESFERRPVQLGMRSAGRVEILGGVAAGERVVTEGAWAVRLAGLAPATADHGHAH